MKNFKTKYRFVAVVLLTVMLSHIMLFHFEVEAKVLCVGDGEHIQIEKLSEVHTISQMPKPNQIIKVVDYLNCTDYRLDNHIDENLTKVNKNLFAKLKYLTTINSSHTSEVKQKNNVEDSKYFANLIAIESLSTIALII